MHILGKESDINVVEHHDDNLLTLIEPLQRHGRIRRPSSRSAERPSKHIRHCFSSTGPFDGSDMTLKTY